MNPITLYGRLIQWVGDGTGAPDTVLHIHAGMAVLFLARVVTRRSLATPIPLACVYLAELGNEILDRVNHGQWMPDTFSDAINTVFWPTVLFLGLRIRRVRLEHGPDAGFPVREPQAISRYEEARPDTAMPARVYSEADI